MRTADTDFIELLDSFRIVSPLTTAGTFGWDPQAGRAMTDGADTVDGAIAGITAVGAVDLTGIFWAYPEETISDALTTRTGAAGIMRATGRGKEVI